MFTTLRLPSLIREICTTIPIADDSFLLFFNAHSQPVVFTLPTRRFGSRWTVGLATGDAPQESLGARALVAVQEHSLILLRRD